MNTLQSTLLALGETCEDDLPDEDARRIGGPPAILLILHHQCFSDFIFYFARTFWNARQGRRKRGRQRMSRREK